MARQLVTSFDFTGTAGTTPAGLSVFRGANLTLDGSGNAQITTNSASQGSFINTGTYASNQYCEATCTNASNAGAGHNIDVGVRAQSESNGYVVIISTSSVDIYKVVTDVFNLVSNVAAGQTWAAGDKFSVEVENNGSNQPVFRVYKTPSGGSIAQIGASVTDTGASPYTGGRPLVMLRQDGAPSMLITAWEAGDVVASSPFTGTAAPAAVRVSAAAGSGLFGVLHYVSGVLIDEVTKNPLANLSGLHAAWFDQGDPALLNAPVDVTTTLTTNGSGAFQFNLPNTLLTTGQIGLMVLANGPLVNTAAYRLTVQ